MSDTYSPAPFTIAPLQISEAPVSSGGSSGVGLGHAIDVDWSSRRTDIKAGVQQDRKRAIAKARAKVEAGWSRPGQMSKSERLRQPASKGTRDTGGLNERRSVLGTVQKAAAAVADAPMDTDISDADFRDVRARLRHAYPGASLSDMLAQAAQLESMLLDAPHEAYQTLIAAYSRVKPRGEYVADVHETGVRASFRRARQDQIDSEELKDWIAKFGKRIPSILAELLATDTALRANPAYEGARLAARYGAAAIESEIPAYENRMAQRAQVKAHAAYGEQMGALVSHHIAAGACPSDEATLEEIAEILQLPNFQPTRGDPSLTLRRAVAIAAHPDHKWISGKRGSQGRTPRNDAGTRSIGGGSPSASHTGPRGSGSVRDSVNRAAGT